MFIRIMLSCIRKSSLIAGLSVLAIILGTASAKAIETAGETTFYAGEKYSDLDAAINDGTYLGVSGSFEDPKQESKEDERNLTAVYKITLPEDGQVYAKYWVKAVQENNCFLDFTLYADANLTNVAIKDTRLNYHDVMKTQFVSLKKGTYYLEVITDRQSIYDPINESYGAYFGYVPDDKEFVNFTLSETQPTNKDVIVTVVVNEDCETLWMKPELTKSYYLDSSTYWEVEELLETKEITFTKNGDLTVRIKDIYGNVFMNSISISNIDKEKPAKPALKSYKANTAKVTGSSEKGSVVYAVIGSETYKATANQSTGAFSIKTCKLKKGMSIKVYCMDKAGNKSGTIKVKVK